MKTVIIVVAVVGTYVVVKKVAQAWFISKVMRDFNEAYAREQARA